MKQIILAFSAILCANSALAGQMAKQLHTNDNFSCRRNNVTVQMYSHPNSQAGGGFEFPAIPAKDGLPGFGSWKPSGIKSSERKANIGLYRRNGRYALAILFKDSREQKNIFPLQCDEYVLTNHYKSNGMVYRLGDFSDQSLKSAIMKPYAFGSNCKVLKTKDNSVLDTSSLDSGESNAFSAKAFSIDYKKRNYHSLDDERINAADISLRAFMRDPKTNNKVEISIYVGSEGLGGLTCKYD